MPTMPTAPNCPGTPLSKVRIPVKFTKPYVASFPTCSWAQPHMWSRHEDNAKVTSKSLECAFVTLLACQDNVYKHLFKSLWNIVGTRLSVTVIAPTASGERRPEVFRQSHSLDLLSLIAENIHHKQFCHVPNLHIHPRIHHQSPCRIFKFNMFHVKIKENNKPGGVWSILRNNNKNTTRPSILPSSCPQLPTISHSKESKE